MRKSKTKTPESKSSKELITLPSNLVGYVTKQPIELLGKPEVLGSGTYGVVYGYNTPKGPVAVKISTHKLDGAIDDSSLTEMSFMVVLDHPNVVRIIDAFATVENMGIVLPKAGTSLWTYIHEAKKTGGIPIEDVKLLALQIARGIAYIQSKDILNGDYKPQNILIYDEPQCRLRAVITDFGMATTDACHERVESTSDKFTLWWRAPELLLGAKYTQIADSWSLGVIIADMLVDRPLFAAESEIGVLAAIFQRCSLPNEITWPGVTSLKDWSLKALVNYVTREYPKEVKEYGGAINYLNLGIPRETRYAKTVGGVRTPFDKQTIEALNSLIEVVPSKRISVKQFLDESVWLADVRRYLEVPCLKAPLIESTNCDVALKNRMPKDRIAPRAGFTIRLRSILYDWLIQVISDFHLDYRTLLLGIYILERYLTEVDVKNEILQLVAVASQHIAAIIVNSERAPEVTKYWTVCDNAYTVEQIADMERDIFRVVGIDYYVATDYDLVVSYASKYSPTTRYAAVLFVILTHFTEMNTDRNADLIALSCLLLACRFSGEEFKHAKQANERYKRQEFVEVIGEFGLGMNDVISNKSIRTTLLRLMHGGVTVKEILAKTPVLHSLITAELLAEITETTGDISTKLEALAIK